MGSRGEYASGLTGYSQSRYLLAKRTVDDRALNRHVWNSLQTIVASCGGPRLRVVEIGAGIGTMIERVLDWELFNTRRIEFTAIDAAAACLSEARERLGSRATGCHELEITFDPVDYAAFAMRAVNRGAWHLVMANAVLDLVDLRHALPLILSLLRPGGLFYFTINFDGDTTFLPVIDEELDGLIYQLYHATMNHGSARSASSGSQSGRLLFTHLRRLGAEIIDMGSSDWVVFPSGGGYLRDEAYFLHFLVATIASALAGHPQLAADRFSDWIALRHEQIEQRELALVCHQLDLLGRVDAGGSGPSC